ncbi:hypothetical protein WJX72_010843 [[Myrmecia] bisecta]|uniref:Uncharacterized protein n=1 Tax=[Myrmecia] bisecta TaxID=41462 RepID=A0AAW1QSU2_9CHLO
MHSKTRSRTTSMLSEKQSIPASQEICRTLLSLQRAAQTVFDSLDGQVDAAQERLQDLKEKLARVEHTLAACRGGEQALVASCLVAPGQAPSACQRATTASENHKSDWTSRASCGLAAGQHVQQAYASYWHGCVTATGVTATEEGNWQAQVQ